MIFNFSYSAESGWRIKAVVIGVIFSIIASVLLAAPIKVQAADTIISSTYLDTDNDGTVDTVRWVFDENVTQCTYNAGNWTVNTPTAMNIAVTGLSCTGSDPILNILVSADPNETGAPTNPIISYSNAGNRVKLTSGNAAAHPSVTATDAAKPVVYYGEVTTASSSGILYNALNLMYSEDIIVYSDGAGTTQITGAMNATTSTMGAMTAARTIAGIGTIDATKGGNMATNSATGNSISVFSSQIVIAFNTDSSAYFNSGSTAPSAPDFTPVEDANDLTDLAGNPANSSSVTAFIDAAAWDVTPPTIADTYSCGVGSGRVGRIQATFNESIVDASFAPGNFEGDNDSVNNGVGEEVPAWFYTYTAECDGAADDTDANDNKISFEFSSGIEGTDLAYLHHVTGNAARDHAGNLLATGNALGTEHDKAAPNFISVYTQDIDLNGYIDAMLVEFSEDIDDATLGTGTGWTTDAGSVDSVGTGDTADDEFIVLNFAEFGGDTANQPDLHYSGGGGLADADGSIDVPVEENLVVTFSEPMEPVFDVDTEFFLTPDPGGWSDAWSDGDRTVSLTHNDFDDDVEHGFALAAAEIDSAHGEALNIGGPEDGTWSFTTVYVPGGGGGGGGGGGDTLYPSEAPSTTPEVEITSPESGDEFEAESFFDVYFEISGSGIDTVDIGFSQDGGITTDVVETNIETNESPVSVQVPSGLEGAVHLVVRAYDSGKAKLDTDMAEIKIVAPETVPEEPEEATPTEEVVPESLTDEEIVTGITLDKEGRKILPGSGETGPSPYDGEIESISIVRPGWYIRSYNYDTVYYINDDLERRAFWDATTFMTWARSWDDVYWVTDATLATLPMGAVMLPQPSSVLVKISTDPRTYHAVYGDDPDMFPLRWITTETIATGMLGENWADYIIDLEPTVFANYGVGDDIFALEEDLIFADDFEAGDTGSWVTRDELADRVAGK